MCSMPYISLKNVTLEFPLYGSTKSIRKALFNSLLGGKVTEINSRVSITALKSINLDIKAGDRVALVGHNGAGKSTFLRVIAGIYEITDGIVEVQGKISSLLSPNLGFETTNTGYENIINACKLRGMSTKKIKEKFDEIADFSELSEYLHLPLKTYSAGMQTRLSFAIATAIQPEILLLDESIGMGDAQFAKKAKNRMDQLIENSNIVVMASHADELIQKMCNKAILFERGEVKLFGNVLDVLHCYHGNHQKAQNIMTKPEELVLETTI